MSDTRTEIIDPRQPWGSGTSIDDYLTKVCLEGTMRDVVTNRELCQNARQYFASSLIFNAVWEMDIEAIKQIAYRIDGTVPIDKDRGGYANILGDAIEDVMSIKDGSQLSVFPDDPPVIAMAKVLVYVASKPAGTNWQKRKERNMASQIILERTGGRKAEPTRPLLETKYVEPDWMYDDTESQRTSNDD